MKQNLIALIKLIFIDYKIKNKFWLEVVNKFINIFINILIKKLYLKLVKINKISCENYIYNKIVKLLDT